MKRSVLKTGLALTIIISTFLHHACKNYEESQRVLLQAELLMDERADSSLWLLENAVKKKELSKEQHAAWCLLVTQARDKNYIPHTSDSLIGIATEYYMKKNNPDRQLLTYYYMGRVNHDLNNITTAQGFYLKALETGKSSDNYALIGRIHSNLGTLYTYQDALDLALTHLKKAGICFGKLNEPRSMSFVQRNIGRIYTLQKQPDKAIFYYRQALLYADSLSYSSVLSELGNIYIEKEDYQTAHYYILESLQYIGDRNDYYPVYLTLGKLFYKMRERDSARYYLHKSMNSQRLETRAGSYFYLYKIAKDITQWEEYALFQEKYEILRDSIMRQTYTAETQKMQYLYNNKQAENEATQARLDHAIAVNKIVFLGLVIVILVGCVVIYYLYTHTTRHRKQILQEELFNGFSIMQNSKTEEQLKINMQRVDELENKLTDKTTKDKELIRLEIKLLELENKYITRIIAAKEERKRKLESSEIYNLFFSESIQRITDDDKEALISLTDETYPEFRSHILELYAGISSEDLFMCYLIKANVKGIRISQLMCLSKQAISKRRRRLAVTMLGEDSCPKSLDNFICSL